ncbi:LOW QUALITY PROTEIN: signaling lymphocytic activation molecule [Tachyglossus aculeatus]|uniref:LOW QUALITY PROTEIN: signaling lymphocytic activation molecule n=1 Tax=Tachyglossus aculeatus TaxID=9261 RepID=UPI0018F60946|nr:LOW QUALITY PROTEIN: signaling lymphocytic activation molecule [Tachyglossus aculeatus]
MSRQPVLLEKTPTDRKHGWGMGRPFPTPGPGEEDAHLLLKARQQCSPPLTSSSSSSSSPSPPEAGPPDSSPGPAMVRILLLLSLALVLHCKAGRTSSCSNPERVRGTVGSRVHLPLVLEGANETTPVTIKLQSRGQQNKKKVFSGQKKNLVGKLEARYTFFPENSSLEIAEASYGDAGTYEVSVEAGDWFKEFCLELELFERVSAPSIGVNLTLGNGSCDLTLACRTESKEPVGFNWTWTVGGGAWTPRLQGNILHLTLTPVAPNFSCTCIAYNAVSSAETHFFSSWDRCRVRDGSLQPPRWPIYLALSLVCLAALAMILAIALVSRKKSKSAHFQPPVLTIYAQVQRAPPKKKPESPTDKDPCSTIYVAATAVQPSGSPPPPQTQSCSPMTVYASVTHPDS